jgi:RNA polymerase sigma-70 factor (ECF subfamily)
LDDRLVERACAGDDAAAAELIRTVWPDVYRIAWSILRDRQAAQDAAQEACARAWTGLRGLRRPERLTVWLYRIVVNESRRIQRAMQHDVTSVEVPSREVIVPEERIAIRAAVDALEPRFRLPIVLRYYYGMRSAEIAHVLGASAVAVRWRLMAAKRRLANALDDRSSCPRASTTSDERYADESIATG